MGRMDTKDIFKQAFSQLGGNYSCPEHETAFNDVLERAKNMKKDDNVKQMQFTEITPEYIEPKKSAKILHAAVGIAGAAAVLTGAVFGLNWLSEHGGLKEGGIESSNGAGYHDETIPAQVNSGDSRNLLEAAGDVLEFGDLTATIESVEYDGHFLRVIYKADYHGERETDPKLLNYQFDENKTWNTDPCLITPYEYQETVVRHWYGSFAKLPELGDNYYVFSKELFTGEGENIDNITFEYMPDGAKTSEEAIHVGSYYIPGKEQEHICAVTDKPGIQGVTVSPLGATIISDYDDDTVLKKAHEPQFFIINYKDGTHEEFPNTGNFMQLRLSPDDITPAEQLEFDNLFRKSGISEADGAEMIAAMPEYCINYMMWLKPGTIDIYNIESVTVAGEEIAFSGDEASGIYGEDSEEIKKMLDNYDKLRDIESSPLYTPADEWFDCDGKRVHVTGYAFDTVNLRIRYETCYDEPIKKSSSAAYFYQITNVFPDNSAGCSSADISYDRAEEGIVETLQNIYSTEPVDSLEVPFGDSFFSVSYNSNIPKIEREINKEVSGSAYYRFDRFVLTPYSLSFIVTDGPTDYSTEEGVAFSHAVSDFEVSINFADGSTKEMRGLVDEPSGIAMPDGKAYKFYQFLDPIDINKVVTITVNGWEIYNCERALELGKEFALADGSKGIVTSVQYDGHVCKAEMELRSTDPEYYEHKSYKSKDDPSYSIFLSPHSTMTKECGSGKIEIISDEKGSVIKYTSFFVPLDKDDTLKLYIGDLTDHVERRAGYVEVPLTVPRHEPIKTVTENDEFGRWEITLSPMGFVIEKDGSDFFLDPKNTDCTVVLTDGREEAHTMLSTGHYDKYSSYEYTFGVFDAPLDLDNTQSVSLYGQTIVLGETAE